MARVSRKPASPSIAVWADSPDEERAGRSRIWPPAHQCRVLGRPVQRGRRRPGRRHAADAPSDRQPDAVPAAARARPCAAPGKTVCTVLDFVGHHRKEFRFDRRLRALLGGSRKEIEGQVKGGLPVPARRLPHGAGPRGPARSSSRNIREAVPCAGRRRSRSCDAGRAEHAVTLPASSSRPAWSSRTSTPATETGPTSVRPPAFRSAARPRGVAPARAFGRLLHVDDEERINCVPGSASRASAAGQHHCPTRATTAKDARRLDLADQASARPTLSTTRCGCSGPTRRSEPSSCELFEVLAGQRRSRHTPVASHPTCRSWFTPATRGSRSSPRSASANSAKVAPWQSGVYWAEEAASRPVRLHPRQDQRPVLPHHPLPRLRHQPRPHPLGEPVRHARRRRNRPALPAPRGAGLVGHALRPLRSDDGRSGSSARRRM